MHEARRMLPLTQAGYKKPGWRRSSSLSRADSARPFWPSGLSCLYQLELRAPGLDPFGALHVAGMLAVLAVCVALVLVRRRLAWLSAAFFAYAVIVSPVLGCSQSGPQMVADRYTYLACLPFAMPGAGGLSWCLRHHPARRTITSSGAAALLLLLGMLTFRQTGVWRSSVTLWENAYRVDPHSEIGLVNLGRAYETAGRVQDAVRFYGLSCDEEDPRQREPRKNPGILLASRQHKYDEAIRELEALLAPAPEGPRSLVLHRALPPAPEAPGAGAGGVPRGARALPGLQTGPPRSRRDLYPPRQTRRGRQAPRPRQAPAP